MVRAFSRALLVAVLGLVACTERWTPPSPSSSVVRVPASVDATCATDVTAAMQALIDQAERHKTLRLTPGACYRVEQPLTIENADGFTLDGTGATIRRKQAGPADESARTRAHFFVRESRNVVVRNLELIGPHPEDGRRYWSVYEAQHAFWLDGEVRGFWLTGSTIHGVWGDFVYLAGRPPAIPSHVTIVGNHLELAGRQGVAIVSGRDVVISLNEFVRVARTTLDLEPLTSSSLVERVVFADNKVVDSNRFIGAQGAAALIADVQVLRNELVRTAMHIAVISPGSQNAEAFRWRKRFVIDRNTSSTLPDGGHVVWIQGVEDLRLTNNRWRILARPGATNPELGNNVPQVVGGNSVIVG